MQDANKLPNDLGTAHEVILVQSENLMKLKDKVDELHKSLQEALAEIRFLRSGKKREKFINADQLLLEFPEDKELQASLEAAKKEAEEAIAEIIYTRTKAAKPRKVAADTFPAHLPRETVEVAIPEDIKKRIESGEMILVRQAIRESLKFVPSKLVVVEYKEPVSAFAHTPEKEILAEGEVNLGDKGLYLESVVTHMTRGTAKIEELLPDRWKAAHPHAVREYREQERRDKADTAIVQAARRRVRAEPRKDK